jgi:hypothetical protein
LLLSISVGIGQSALKKEPEEHNDSYITKRRNYKNFVVEKRERYY